MTQRTHWLLAAPALAAALLLSACGGGGGGSDSTTSGMSSTPDPALVPVPASASSSVSAMVGFLQSLVSSDTAPPLDVTNFAPPKPDDAEPTPLS